VKYWAIVTDTWRESWARKSSLVIALLVLGLLALYAFGLQLHPALDGSGRVVTLFGAEVGTEADLTREGIASFSAFFALSLLTPWGLLLALLVTVGLFTATFRPQNLYWVLAKPISRVGLYLAQYAGALLLVGVTSMGFVLGMDALIWWKTGVWQGGFVLSGLLFVFEYAVLAAVALLVAVWSRSTGISLMGAILLYVLASTLQLVKTQFFPLLPELWRHLVNGLYVVLPKTPDLETLGLQQIGADLGPQFQVQLAFSPTVALASTALFALAALALGAWEFHRRDY